MPRVLTGDEYAVVKRLKSQRIFLKLNDSVAMEKIGSSEGIVATACADDHTDMIRHLRNALHTEVIHPVRVFGGPLVFVPSYGDHCKEACAWLLNNIIQGMRAKDADCLVLFEHGPCAMLDEYGHSIEDAVRWIIEIEDFFFSIDFFKDKKIIFLFHVKRKNKAGAIEQNTYMVDTGSLRSFLKQTKL